MNLHEYAAGIATAANEDEPDNLSAARGVVTGVLVAAFCWLAFAVFVVAAVS